MYHVLMVTTHVSCTYLWKGKTWDYFVSIEKERSRNMGNQSPWIKGMKRKRIVKEFPCASQTKIGEFLKGLK